MSSGNKTGKGKINSVTSSEAGERTLNKLRFSIEANLPTLFYITRECVLKEFCTQYVLFCIIFIVFRVFVLS